jgi:methionyl aminopeptidase
MTGTEADALIHDFIIKKGAYPTPIGFMKFPKSVCISLNESIEVYHMFKSLALCHGIPCDRPFEAGDYVNYDITVFKDGVHGDNSVMVEYGDVNPLAKRIIDITKLALYEAIRICKPGAWFRDIGNVCEYFPLFILDVQSLC